MKIMMMSNTYLPIVGGLERSIEGFTAQYRKRGHRVVIVTPEFEETPDSEKGVIRIPAIQKFSGTDFSINLPVPGLLSKLMESFKPDIVHAHHPFLVGDMALRLCGQYKVALVFTYHTMFEKYVHYLPFRHEIMQRFLVELAAGYANLTDQVIAPSESIREILIKRGVKIPIEVIPTGIRPERFAKGSGTKIRRKLKIPEKAFVAGIVGRVAEEKNLEVLGKAVLEFMKKNKDSYFLVVGKGPSEKELKNIFRKERLQKRLLMPGVLEKQALTDAYHAMDCFVFASQSETQGIVLCEAMAAGIPVLALDAPAVRDIVKDKENGRLVADSKPGALASAIEWFYGLTERERNELVKKARETAGEFSIEHCADRTLEIYQRIRVRQKPQPKGSFDPWLSTMRRIKTEWEMFSNLSKASGRAFFEGWPKNKKETAERNSDVSANQ